MKGKEATGSGRKAEGNVVDRSIVITKKLVTFVGGGVRYLRGKVRSFKLTSQKCHYRVDDLRFQPITGRDIHI